MKFYVVAVSFVLVAGHALAAPLTGQGQAHGIGGNVECEYPQLFQHYKDEALLAAQSNALELCQNQLGHTDAQVVQTTTETYQVSCFYKGPWMALSDITVKAKAEFDCF